MQDGSTDVKSQGVVVGTAVFPIYDTVAEALGGVGEAKLLSMINAQIKTTKANELRASLTGKPSKANQIMEAIMRIPIAEQSEHAGDLAWMSNRIEAEIATMNKERAETASVPVAPDAGSDEDLESIEADEE